MSNSSVLRGVAVSAQPFALPVAPGMKITVAAPSTEAPMVQVPTPAVIPADVLEAEFKRGVELGRAEAVDYYKLQFEELKSELEQQAVAAREAAAAEARLEGLAQAGAEIAQRMAEESKSAQARFATQAEALSKLLQGAEGAANKRAEELEDDIVALCHGIVCKLLGDKITSAEAVHGMAREAIKSLHGKPLTIAVHPDDLELLAELRDELAPHAQWKADPALALGGMRIRGETESLDATLETQLAGLKKLLLEVRARHKERH
jgi:flagellar biosynthesis/type III secretory pathway protein FliH